METALGEYLVEAPVFVRTFPGIITYWTQGAEQFYGYTWEEAMGQSAHELFKTVFPEPLADINRQLLHRGVWGGLLQHCRKDGGTVWSQSHWRLKGDSPDPAHLIVVETNLDVTQRETLSRELNHRLKNTLAVVGGIAQMSLRSCNAEELRSFSGRLAAFARAQDLLMSHHWQYGELGALVRESVSAFSAADRVEMEGEYVTLNPNSVLAYSLALHELMTNAFKYGALSVPEGRVRISWSLTGEANDRIRLVWREMGGPPVTPPARAGFGTKMIGRLLASELGTSPMEWDFKPDGLVAVITGPAQKLALRKEQTGQVSRIDGVLSTTHYPIEMERSGPG